MMFRKAIDKFKKLVNFPGLSAPPETIPSNQSIFSIHLNIAIVIAMYAFFADIFIAIGSASILLLNYSRHKKQAKPFKRIVMICLQVACIALFAWRFNGSGGQSWMGLLTLLICLKSLESKNLRDYYVTILMVFFLAAIIFAYNNSAIAPIILAMYSVSVLATLMLLSRSNIPITQATLYDASLSSKEHHQQDTTKSYLRSIASMSKPASKLLLQALPITVLLFLLFPRIQGSFGFLPDDNSNLKPSLANQMNAGSYSERASSRQLAFRAEFLPNETGNPVRITTNNLYWRVKTFSQQQGFSWQMKATHDLSSRNLFAKQNEPVTENLVAYAITHQPTADNFIPSLESVISSEQGLILKNNVIKSKSKPSTFRYNASSTLQPKTLLNLIDSNKSQPIQNQLSLAEWKQYTQTTNSPGKQTTALLNQWLTRLNMPKLGSNLNNDSQQVIPNSDQAKKLALFSLQFFREKPFSYHLFPPELDNFQPIEDFLFNTQSGYCEHYSSTFSTLMRWLKIPTRVVAGFQGGEYNPNGGFYEVRYSSAHAWNEIWTPKDGWIRVDPTAAVAPERIEFGMDALFALMKKNGQEGFNEGDYNLAKLRDILNPSSSFGDFKKVKSWFDATNHAWDKWVVNYSFDQQRELLKKLGIESDNQYLTLTIILGLFLTIFGLIVLWLIWPKRVKGTDVEEAYALFKEKIQKLDISIESNEGPFDLTTKLIKLLPHHEADIKGIYQYYIENQYKNDNKNLSLFLESVKRFKPVPTQS